MSIVSKEELIQVIASVLGETPDDTGLEIIENLTDTLNEYESKTVDTSEWENKYTELDNSWRKRYKERFLLSSDAEHITSPEDNDNLKFEDLFERAEP